MPSTVLLRWSTASLEQWISLGLCAIVALSGCSTSPFVRPRWSWPWSKPTVVESEYQVPTRMAVVWTPDVLTLPGRPPTRGFGGRIYFYNHQGQAIPVDGQLVVYGFDDSDSEVASTVPHKRFVFTPEQFTKHFSPTELGASYSIWIPWDANDTRQKTISLLPVFTSVSGHRLVGDQTLNVLRGQSQETVLRREEWRKVYDQRRAVEATNFHQSAGEPQPVGGSSPPQSNPTAGQPLRTSTIPLTPALGRALQENPPPLIGAQVTAWSPRMSPGNQVPASNNPAGGFSQSSTTPPSTERASFVTNSEVAVAASGFQPMLPAPNSQGPVQNASAYGPQVTVPNHAASLTSSPTAAFRRPAHFVPQQSPVPAGRHVPTLPGRALWGRFPEGQPSNLPPPPELR